MLVGLYSPTAPATLRFSLTMRTSTSTTPSADSYGVGRSEVFGAGQYAMAALDKARSAGETGHYRYGYY